MRKKNTAKIAHCRKYFSQFFLIFFEKKLEGFVFFFRKIWPEIQTRPRT